MKRICNVIAAILLVTTPTLFAGTPTWGFDTTTEGWNDDYLARLYFHHSEWQRQWAWELIGQHSFQGNEKVLDLGCGDGKLSADMSHFVRRGCVDGFDLSSAMLRVARKRFPPYVYPNLTFHKLETTDFSDVLREKEYDVVTAFCVFHVVKDPLDLLTHLGSHMKKGGKLYLVIPTGHNAVFFQAGEEMIDKYGLKKPWLNDSVDCSNDSMFTPAGCAMLLSQAGLLPVNIDKIDAPVPFLTRDDFHKWLIGTISANWSIPLDIADPFFDDMITRMEELDPSMVTGDGVYLVKYDHINVIAERY